MSKYDGRSAVTLARSGGSVRVTCASNVGQGNGGTSLACKGCFIQAVVGNTEVVKMNIGAAASAILGVDLGRPYIYDGTEEASAATVHPLFIPISDVAELYFYSADANAIIDILYFIG